MNKVFFALILIIVLYSCRNNGTCDACIIDAVRATSTSSKLLTIHIKGKGGKVYPVVLEKNDISSIFSRNPKDLKRLDGIDSMLIDAMCNRSFIYLNENQERIIADFIPDNLHNERDIIKGGKERFLKTFFDSDGFLNIADKEIQASIVYLAFTEWGILTYRDDESGFIRITKCSREVLNWQAEWGSSKD